ncbi:twitching motility protein pilt [hydrocarbon metagenome]|uniref:Twitching motility protein pilt n=1 Tax=hydrocarbon metagenome TaxID=938273 RepID=A0A0W8E8Z5_9ZZZZ
MVVNIMDILSKGIEYRASDIHLTVSQPPLYRVDGELISAPGDPLLSPEDTEKLAQQLIPGEAIRQEFETDGQVDFSNSFSGIGRFRANIYRQRGSCAAAVRLIPVEIPTIDQLKLPPIVSNLALRDRGLILVTGVTGSGKSTTLAALINHINENRKRHIITLEDPIEYLHKHKNSIINQREIGTDTASFNQALKATLRQDPDVILIGEMRDLETISTVLTAAETGHLVMATLHSASAASSVERIVDVFPTEQQRQIRIQLASCLQGIITQQLLMRHDISGRTVAAEILVATPAIRNMIRENKTHQIYSAMQTGQAVGMVTMERSIKTLYGEGIISREEYERLLGSIEFK